MAVKTITFPGAEDHATPGVTAPWPILIQHPWGLGWNWVRVRNAWSSSWKTNYALIPTEVTWSVAPTLPVAIFEAHYGEVKQPDELGFFDVTRAEIIDLVGSLVWIELATQMSPTEFKRERHWYGIITEAHDQRGGVSESTGKDYGTITLVAYGLEKLLTDHVITNAYCMDKDGFEVITGVPIDFNRQGPRGVQGNRSEGKLGTSYVFGGRKSTNMHWSSKDILEYLIRYQTPLDHAGAIKVPFRLELPIGIPTDVDAPVIKTQNATTYSIISQILDRRRVTMWWVEYDADTNACVIKADSIVKTPITGTKITIPANSNQINLQYDGDPLTNSTINNSALQKVDQVVSQGPRIRCVGSFMNANGDIEGGWDSTLETTYEAGGGTHPAGTPLKRKQTRNDAARRSPELETVYSLFRVPETWNMNVNATEVPLFVDDAGSLKKQNVPELFFEQTLPLLEGVDYSGSRIEAGAVPTKSTTNEEIRPFVLFKKPWTTSPIKYQAGEGSVAGVETTNAKENPRLSCYVSVPQHTLSIRIKVQGQPQHAIAFSEFVPIAGEDPKVGEFDWKDAVFTASILSQDQTEGRWPETLLQGEAIRKKVIYAGDQYFQDYVAPYTVIGLDEDGELVYSTSGGHIPLKGGDDDPADMLTDIAKIAASWYTIDHAVITLESYRLKPAEDIPLGALILKAGGDPEVEGKTQQIDAPVTQITFTYPSSKSDRPQPGRMQIKTWAGELDVVELVDVSPLELREHARASTGVLSRKG